MVDLFSNGGSRRKGRRRHGQATLAWLVVIPSAGAHPRDMARTFHGFGVPIDADRRINGSRHADGRHMAVGYANGDSMKNLTVLLGVKLHTRKAAHPNLLFR
jgi:hypothetical protein